MFRSIPALAAVLSMAFLAGCGPTVQYSQPRASAPEAVAGPDCRAYCERSYRVCMDSSAPRRSSDDERRDRLFGPTATCENQLRSCFKGCAPVQ